MSLATTERATWLRRFQSGFVLPVARVWYLVIAGGSLLAVLFAVAIAIFLHLQTMGQPDRVAIPPAFSPPVPAISLAAIDARLAPPSDIRFVVTRGLIDRPLTEKDILGHFDATTPNGLAPFPSDFEILGGKDARMFRRVALSAAQPRAALIPTPALVERINGLREILSVADQARFEVTVAARDTHGAFSPPTDITFELWYGPPQARAPGQAQAAGTTNQLLSPLQQLAHEIALTLDPGQTTAYYEHNRRALQVPGLCGASEATPGFLGAYRRAFEHVRAKLAANTIEAFYVGLCESWRQMLGERENARQRAEAERNSALQRNLSLQTEFELRRFAASQGRNLALIAAVSAFGAFLAAAILLAVFAIENHASSIRQQADAIAAAVLRGTTAPDARQADQVGAS